MSILTVSKNFFLIMLFVMGNFNLHAMEENHQSEEENHQPQERSSFPSTLTINLPPLPLIKYELQTELRKSKKYSKELKPIIHFIWDDIQGEISFGEGHDLDNFLKEEKKEYLVRITDGEKILIIYSDKSNDIVDFSVIVHLKLPPDYESCKLSSYNEGSPAEWKFEAANPAPPPTVNCVLKESSKHKQTLKERTLEAVAKHTKSGDISIEDVDWLPNDLKRKLPDDLKSQLTVEE